MSPIEYGAVPVDLTVAFCGALVAPTKTSPKASCVGVTSTPGVGVSATMAENSEVSRLASFVAVMAMKSCRPLIGCVPDALPEPSVLAGTCRRGVRPAGAVAESLAKNSRVNDVLGVELNDQPTDVLVPSCVTRLTSGWFCRLLAPTSASPRS